MGAVVAGLFWLARRTGRPLSPATRWLAIAAAVLPLGFAWRTAEALLVLTLAATATAFGLAAAYAAGQEIRRGGLFDYAAGTAAAYLHGIAAVFLLPASDIQWSSMPRTRWSAAAGAILRGLLIAVPLLLIFGALFSQADAVFANLVGQLTRFTPETFFSHLFVTGFFACLAAGWLRTTLHATVPDVSGLKRPASWTLGSVEMTTTLGLLNLLFLAFVAVQFRYFFGGAALVEATTGLTYAEYAREGFFQLVTVVALVLPLLLVGHWLLPAENPRQERTYRWLAGALIAQLAIIMTSALQRMLLYVAEYGLTEGRLYTTVFMGWLAVLLLWFCLTALRGQRERFAFGALVSGLAVLAALYALNPDAYIVRTNLDRLAAGKRFDAAYNASLSADAVPTLVAQGMVDLLQGEDRRIVQDTLEQRFNPATDGRPWYNWNYARSRALKAIETINTLP
jgi:hypothetical protein